MPKLIVSIDGVVVKEAQLTKNRTTIGRRPFNDLVIDHLAVSGEHAAIELAGADATLEDLGSTNGTFVNGSSIRKKILAHDDLIEIGKYKLRYLSTGPVQAAPAPAPAPAPSPAPAAAPVPAPAPVPAEAPPGLMGMDAPFVTAPAALTGPRLRVLSGSAAGRELALTKVVTTIGKPRVAIASVTHKAHGYDLAAIDGMQGPTVNGTEVRDQPVTLRHQDEIELGGTRLIFLDQ